MSKAHPNLVKLLKSYIATEKLEVGTSLLTECVVLEYPYWLNVLCWNIPTDQVFGTGISLRAECFVLEYPY